MTDDKNTSPVSSSGGIEDGLAAAFQNGFTNGNAAWEETPDHYKDMFREGVRCLLAVLNPTPAASLSGQFLPTEDGEFNGNEPDDTPPVSSRRDLLRRMSLALDDLSPDETIGYSNGVGWIEVATVEEIRKAARGKIND